MRQESKTEISLKDHFAAKDQSYTDTRMTQEAVTRTVKEMQHFENAYWGGVFAGRVDPCIRAVRFYFNERKKKTIYRFFSYDEIIATATLMLIGLPKRIAAAMAFHEVALAVPANTAFDPGERPASVFEAVRVRLVDDSLWDVIFEREPKFEELSFVGDFSVWFDVNGQKSDPDDGPCANQVLTLIADCEVEDCEAATIH